MRKAECCRCNRVKDNDRQSYCKPCRADYRAEHYAKNKPVYFAKSKTQRVRNRILVQEAKNRPCADCGITYNTWQMTFDHLPGSDKRWDVSTMAGRKGKSTILSEIAKCEVVCFNCHADRTHKRYQAGIVQR